jgi:hypothetical protein
VVIVRLILSGPLKVRHDLSRRPTDDFTVMLVVTSSNRTPYGLR